MSIQTFFLELLRPWPVVKYIFFEPPIFLKFLTQLYELSNFPKSLEKSNSKPIVLKYIIWLQMIGTFAYLAESISRIVGDALRQPGWHIVRPVSLENMHRLVSHITETVRISVEPRSADGDFVRWSIRNSVVVAIEIDIDDFRGVRIVVSGDLVRVDLQNVGHNLHHLILKCGNGRSESKMVDVVEFRFFTKIKNSFCQKKTYLF